MKYLYPYECDKRGLSNPNELQAAIDSNRREGRRQSFGSSLFTYSPNGTPTMLSSPKMPTPSVGLSVGCNGASLTPIQKIKKGGKYHNRKYRLKLINKRLKLLNEYRRQNVTNVAETTEAIPSFYDCLV